MSPSLDNDPARLWLSGFFLASNPDRRVPKARGVFLMSVCERAGGSRVSSKRTSEHVRIMSALPLKADIGPRVYEYTPWRLYTRSCGGPPLPSPRFMVFNGTHGFHGARGFTPCHQHSGR